MNDQELAEHVAMMENGNIGYQGHFVGQQDAQDHLNNTQNQHGNDNHR
jgi:hypothetical protein